jgi:hypothetical protein
MNLRVAGVGKTRTECRILTEKRQKNGHLNYRAWIR